MNSRQQAVHIRRRNSPKKEYFEYGVILRIPSSIYRVRDPMDGLSLFSKAPLQISNKPSAEADLSVSTYEMAAENIRIQKSRSEGITTALITNDLKPITIRVPRMKK